MRIKYFLPVLLSAVLGMNGCFHEIEKNSPQEQLTTSLAPDCPVPEQSSDPAAQWRTLDLKKYPDANTILLDDIEQVTYNCDGTYTRCDESWTLIVTDSGRRDLRTITLHFNEFYQNVPQIYIDIIKPDGRVVKPILQKNITVEASQMQSNIYDPANKVLNVGIPDLEIGDIVHAQWSMQTVKSRMQGIWCDLALLQSTQPILHYTYTISAPEACPLQNVAVKNEVAGTLQKSVKHQDGRIYYYFEAKDVPQILPEPDMVPYYLHAMRVISSTAQDWPAISRWYYNLCEKRLQAVSPELTGYARKLADGKSDIEAVRALFDFVAKEIRYTGVTNEDSAPGYEPHDVKDTFAQKHGVCRDKAALLTAMLREVGLDAFMVLFMAGDPKDPEVPNNYFNHAVTGVKMPDGELILMDPTDENSSELLPAYAMDKSFLCATAQGDVLRRTPVIPPEKNLLTIRSQGVIDENYLLTLQSTMTFGGINDNIYRGAFARWTPAYRQQFIASALKKSLPGAVVKNVKILPEDVRDLSQPFQLIIEISVADFVDIKWGTGMLSMPFLSSNFGALNFMLGDKILQNRRYPMQLFSTAGIDEKIQLTLPAGLNIVALPDYKSIKNDFLQVDNSISGSGQQLQAGRQIMLKKVEVPAEKYSNFRKAVLEISSADNCKVIVKRSFADETVKFSAAPAVLEDYHISVKFDSLSSYTVDCRQKIRVLNYSGIKDFSELTLSFIPGISQAEFIAGSVTYPDGQSWTVDLKTIQLMDDGNANAAPRYPVGKKLVVPLPGVKENSTIEYHWQIKFKDFPYSDYFYCLWRYLPVFNGVVEFQYPEKLSNKITLMLPEAGFKVEKSTLNKLQTVKVYSSSIPLMPMEPGTPSPILFAPTAGISLFNQADYCDNLRKKIIHAAANSPQSGELAQKLTAAIPDIPGKIRAIRNYVAKNIRAAGAELNTLGLKYITPADTVLQENYGNSLDRAVLLYAMLNAVGINDIKILLASDLPAWTAERFLALPRNCFDEVLLMVKNDEEEFYLNDVDEYAPLDYCRHNNMLGLNTDNGELIVLDADPVSLCQSVNEWVVSILPGGSAEFSCTTTYYGGEYARWNRFFANITPEEERQFWEQQFSGVLAGAEMLEKSRNFEHCPGVVKMKFVVPDFWKKSGEYMSFTLPSGGAENWVNTAGKRTLPYNFVPPPANKSFFYVELPAEWQFCELDGGNYMCELPGAQGVIKQKTEFTPGLLEMSLFSGFFRAVYCDPSAYGLLEDYQKKLANPANRTFLFKTTGK